MREIKFRAWDKFNGKMVYADMDRLLDGYKACDMRVLAQEEQLSPIMQYTGLKDKNGVEIYEGDVVRIFKRGRWQIVWGIDGWIIKRLNGNPRGYGLATYTDCVDETAELGLYEVIGNIHENPDLITQKETT